MRFNFVCRVVGQDGLSRFENTSVDVEVPIPIVTCEEGNLTEA